MNYKGQEKNKMDARERFRFKEKREIQQAILGDTGNIVEVFGPPMVGKSALIDKVIDDIQKVDQSPDEQTIYYKFWCKNIYVLQDLFHELFHLLSSPDQIPSATTKDFETFYEMSFILKLIKNIVTRSDGCRHIFVFHKCESFHINGTSFAFLSFLGEMINMFQFTQCKVHIVFSTYKRFSLSGHKTRQVNVGMLINPCDIICLLSHHAPGVHIIDYVYICQRYLCLPEPIVQIASSYISMNKIYTPKLLEVFLTKDLKFYSEMFGAKQFEVCSWLSKYELDLIDIMCRTGFNPFSKGYVESLVVHAEKGDSAYKSLRENLVFQAIQNCSQLIVHPLVLYKCSLDQTVREPDVLNKTNSYKQFLGRAMIKAETNTEKHGIKGQTYACHRLEWPYIRQLFQKAILYGNFQDIFRVALVARRLIFVLYPNESKKFYAGLFETTQAYGSPREAAVMEACLGHITASGADINFQSALRHLDCALETLKHSGPTFFYKWTLRRKAIILFRMSRYPQSSKCFEKAKAITRSVPMPPQDHKSLSVSEYQIEEEEIIGEIYEAIPMIFTGDNVNALEKLHLVHDSIHDRYENHPDLEVLLNNIGLVLQRGYGDLQGALRWYTKSLKHRSLLIRINPQLMLVTLNNVAMIKLQIGDLVGAERDLQTALTIIREGIWYHYSTALTLTSLAEIKVKLGKYQEAHDSLLTADEILEKLYKANDYRLKVKLLVFHLKLLLDDKDATYLRTDLVSSNIENLVDLGFTINKHMSDESHHQLMSVYEHGMVVNWAVSNDKVKEHKEMLLRHVEENPIVKDLLENTELLPGRQSVLFDHRHFVNYLKRTEFDDLELDKFLDNLNLTCPPCRIINEILGQEMWLKERLSPSAKRNVITDQHKPLGDFSSFSDISSKTSFQLEDLQFLQEKQNVPIRHPYLFMQKYNSELVYLYHSGRDYPSKYNRQRIHIVNTFGMTLSGIKLINPSTGPNFVMTLPSTRSSTNCAIVNPSISLAHTASQGETSVEGNILQITKLALPVFFIRQSDYRGLGVVNPSKSVDLDNCQCLMPTISPVSAGLDVLNGSIDSVSPIVASPTHDVGLKILQKVECANRSIVFSHASDVSLNSHRQDILNPYSAYSCSCVQDIVNPSSVFHCPCVQDILNLSSVYNCPCVHDILNSSSVFNCFCEQDILNPSSVYNCFCEHDILNPSSVFNCPREQGVLSHNNCSSFEYLFGLSELVDWNDLYYNVIALDYRTSQCSRLHFHPIDVHSIENYGHYEEYVWVGSHLSERPDNQSLSSNPMLGLRSGLYGCSELLWGSQQGQCY